MNRYGRMAADHWAAHRPMALAALPNPGSFFTELGEQVAAEIELRARALAGEDLQGAELGLEKLRRLNMARLTAEEDVLEEVVFRPAEQPVPAGLVGTPIPWTSRRAPAPEMDSSQPQRWIPIVLRPGDPGYEELEDDPGFRPNPRAESPRQNGTLTATPTT